MDEVFVSFTAISGGEMGILLLVGSNTAVQSRTQKSPADRLTDYCGLLKLMSVGFCFFNHVVLQRNEEMCIEK